MKKLLLLALLTSTLLFTACGKEETNNIGSKNNQNRIENAVEQGFPAIEDLKLEITQPLELQGGAYYGKFRLSNNSKFNIKSWKTLYRNDSEEEVILVVAETLTPGEVSVEQNMFSSEGAVDIENSKPIWAVVMYVDENGEENYYKYDYKLESYENY